MAFNLAFPCIVDVGDESSLTSINGANITLNNTYTQAGQNAYSMTYTDIATEYELAHMNTTDIQFKNAGETVLSIDSTTPIVALYDGNNTAHKSELGIDSLIFSDVSGNQLISLNAFYPNVDVYAADGETRTIITPNQIELLGSAHSGTIHIDSLNQFAFSIGLTTSSIAPTNITDTTTSNGTANQLLSSTASGIKWVDSIAPVYINDITSSSGSVGYSLTSTATGIKWAGITLANVCGFGTTASNIQPTNITDTASSTGTNGQVLTKQTGGITWSPNFPNIATYKQSWASTSTTISAANTLLYTSTAITVGTATATFLITFQMTAQSTGNHSMIATIGRGTTTPATDQAYNLAKPGANNLTAAINLFGSNLGTFGGGQPISTSTISFTDTPGAIGTYYYSIWCWATANNSTSQWSNFNVIQIKP